MKPRNSHACLVLLVGVGAACEGTVVGVFPEDGGVPSDAGDNPFLPRATETSCRAFTGAMLADYRTEDAFPSLRFDRPLWVGVPPGDSGSLFVAEQGGTIHAFDADSGTSEMDLFLSLTVRREGNEEGLLGLAFHPDYASNGEFFVNYSSSQGCPDGFVRCSIVSRFSRRSAREADPASEERLIVLGQPFSNHNGGSMHFGRDGFLYISFGDGGSGNDPNDAGQDTTTLHGNILRIDVDNASGGRRYGIPAGNPFASGGGAPEIYAWGLRNVWRMSEDPETGVLWAGDVGQGTFEEINKITEPGNMGWRIREGFACRGGGSDCPNGGYVDPVHAYPHTVGRSVTGGVVVRGGALAELDGVYFFGDFVSGQVFSLQENEAAAPTVTPVFSVQNPSSFGVDAAGEVLITTFAGRVERIVRDGDLPRASAPERLSETGCFADLATHEPAPGVVPYELNVPFWSDGVDKQRFIALPAGSSASVSPAGDLTFPVGTAFLKTFFGEDGRRLETRIFAQGESGWSGHSYRWNTGQDEAFRVDDTEEEDLLVAGEPVRWTYPSSAQCNACHTQVAGHVLGFEARQLQRSIPTAASSASQIGLFEEAGLLAPAGRLGAAEAFPVPASAADVDSHARAWLHVNCAMCHVQGGPTPVSLDLQFDTPLDRTHACDVTPSAGDLGIANAVLLAPGEPERSLLHTRTAMRGAGQMPPLASRVADADGVEGLRQWIASLSACP